MINSKLIRSYILTGLAVWIPILVTFGVVRFIVDLLDQSLSLLPKAYQPAHLFGTDIPGLGVLLSLIILILTGMGATNFLGQRIMSWSESILDRIPLVRTIYNATKQIIQAVFATNSQAFRKVLLVEYPRKGIWSVAFQTGVDQHVTTHTKKEMLSVFIPTTPNPTSGFLMLVPKDNTVELDMTIDEALKYIISLGVMPPTTPDAATPAPTL